MVACVWATVMHTMGTQETWYNQDEVLTWVMAGRQHSDWTDHVYYKARRLAEIWPLLSFHSIPVSCTWTNELYTSILLITNYITIRQWILLHSFSTYFFTSYLILSSFKSPFVFLFSAFPSMLLKISLLRFSLFKVYSFTACVNTGLKYDVIWLLK
jgi:hypothetical protein